MIDRIKSLSERVRAMRTFGQTEYRTEVLEQKAATMAAIRATLPRDRAMSEAQIEAQAMTQLRKAFVPKFREQAAQTSRAVWQALDETARAFSEWRASNRRVVLDADALSEAQAKDARPIEIATLRELRQMNLRAEIEDARRAVSPLPLSERVDTFERLTASLATRRHDLEAQLAPLYEKRRNAEHEPESFAGHEGWRASAMARADKAIADAKAEWRRTLQPTLVQIRAVQETIGEALAAPVAVDTTRGVGVEAVAGAIGQASARKALAERFERAQDRLVDPAVLREEEEAKVWLAGIDEMKPRVSLLLKTAIEQGQPLGMDEAGVAEAVA